MRASLILCQGQSKEWRHSRENVRAQGLAVGSMLEQDAQDIASRDDARRGHDDGQDGDNRNTLNGYKHDENTKNYSCKQ